MKCLLHIGTEKTGTSTIQRFLFDNRQKLEEIGIHYPLLGCVPSIRELPVMAYNLDRRCDFTQRYGLSSDSDLKSFQVQQLKALSRQLGSCRSTDYVVFSCEHLQSRLRSTEEISRLSALLASLGFDECRIVVFLREQVALANSLYSTMVVDGGFSGVHPPSPHNDPTGYFEHVCNHRKTLERFSSVFGESQITPVIFDRGRMRGRSVLSSFLEILNVPSRVSFEFPSDVNRSATAFAIELIRNINEQIPRLVDGKPNLARQHISFFVKKALVNGTAYMMPESVAAEYRRYYESGNEWVRSHFFSNLDTLFLEPGFDTQGDFNYQCSELADVIVGLWRRQYGQDRTTNGVRDLCHGISAKVTRLLYRFARRK